MAAQRVSESELGKYLKPKIKAFMKENADAATVKTSIDDGIDAIAHAIAYGMAIAWSSPIMQAAFATGVVPPPVPPAVVTVGNPIFGQTIHGSLAPSLIES